MTKEPKIVKTEYLAEVTVEEPFDNENVIQSKHLCKFDLPEYGRKVIDEMVKQLEDEAIEVICDEDNGDVRHAVYVSDIRKIAEKMKAADKENDAVRVSFGKD